MSKTTELISSIIQDPLNVVCYSHDHYIYTRLVPGGPNYTGIGKELGISKERVRKIAERLPDWRPEGYLTVPQFAELTGRSVSIVYRYIYQGRLDAMKVGA